jgi:4-hydroxyphenylacetate 3-monooxygenase
MATAAPEKVFLKTGEEYKESLRDGRDVWYRGERIADVTKHPLTGPGIEWNSRIFDMQFEPEHQEALTFIREDGARCSTAWLLPKTPDDLRRHREAAELIAWETYAVMGRQLDMLPWTQLGLNALKDMFDKYSPEYSGNLETYLNYAQENNVHLAAVVVEPQGSRSRSISAGADRSSVLRTVKEDSTGIWLSGARAVGSYSPQANEVMVGSIWNPALEPNEAFWCTIPIATEGLTMVCRDGTTDPSRSVYDHPVEAKGEEIDAFVMFEEVFVPKERIFALGARELCDGDAFNHISRGEHWHVLNRLCVKAEWYVGLAQMVVDALSLGNVPVIRDQVGKLITYAQVLRAGVIAAETQATYTNAGVLLPDVNIIAAVRSYGLEELPKMTHILQELCGQGLVMRFSEADYAAPEIGPKLERYLDHTRIDAKNKNLLMNLIWDYTTGSHAGRSALFENVNALPAFILRQRLYTEFDRTPLTERLCSIFGIEYIDEPNGAAR